MYSIFDYNTYVLFIELIVSITCTFLLISHKDKYKAFINTNFNGPQKIHDDFVPRLGGISFYVSILFCTFFFESDYKIKFYFIILSCLPAFISGICEDLTHLITPKIRLLASILSAIIFIFLLKVKITHVGISFIDYALGSIVLSVFVTVLSISILIQAYNIIDGLNGLANINFILLLISVLVISYDISYFILFELSLCLLIAILGVFLFNFPFGNIFLGDGGAYALGAISSFLVILLTQLNEIVHPSVALLLIIYPVYELIRSFVRRSFKGLSFIFKPDDKHLHSLVYRYKCNHSKQPNYIVNSSSTIKISIIPIFSSIWSCLFYDDVYFIYSGIIFSILLYEYMYFNYKLNQKNDKF